VSGINTESPLITLTTDFGLSDPYVAAIKGVLRTRCPEARIDDLSHAIPPQDLFAAAYFLVGAVPYFPPGTIHLVVVDPGVGTGRHAMLAAAGGQYFVCPDNGMLSLFLRVYPLQEARLITNPALMLHPVSPTFHGRDIFTPAAAFLACGGPPQDLGPPLDTLEMLPFKTPVRNGPELVGAVVHVDHFGNCITNIHRREAPPEAIHTVSTAGNRLRLRATYAQAAPGATLALYGSTGYLEIAVREGSAARFLHLERGAPVRVVMKPA